MHHEDTITYYGNVHVSSRPTIGMCRCEILFWLPCQIDRGVHL